MKKLLLKGVLLSACILGLFSCESDDNETPWVEPKITTTGIYILNQGYMYGNNSDLAYYDKESGITNNVFDNQNGIKLGDTGQHLLIYGSKMYITVTESNKIFITDLTGKILKRTDKSDASISPKNESGQPLKPHSLIAHKGKVYVSLYGGYVAQIDTTSLNLDLEKKIAVGSYPEQMTIVNDLLYVVNTRSPSDSISVIDLNNLTVTKNIHAVENPTNITSDKYKNIYIISMGNYDNIKPTLQKIKAGSNIVETIGVDVATGMTIDNDRLLLIYKDPMLYPTKAKLTYYNITSETIVNKSFVSNTVDLGDATSISIDPSNRDMYIATSNYITHGSMNIFSTEGTHLKTFNTNGYNPIGAFFITQAGK